MLYVRYGSGCSRRVTASAARPSAARSCDSSSREPLVGAEPPAGNRLVEKHCCDRVIARDYHA